jgi:hypothetical protein
MTHSTSCQSCPCPWCSEIEKDEALIIDLANNPKTKISKVDMALQFIEEWPLLNDEAEHFTDPEYFVEYNLMEIRAAHRNLTGVELPEKKVKRKKKNATLSPSKKPEESSAKSNGADEESER